mmetsp:Transcript_44225/g.120487  ORF Transcript_44225/g.120487 Transcript_44225/m.120487 type:complete len:155 (-) Transcript_44225:301-765(-)|eukprot:CAMPEP_0119502574 /NCGR_PEP_ID=MMETSP1344-20130328/23998_1 /TAXON_ID=236787 /ORGANISM="Florenciella parvula, Strain CCMP2471" /LENGTH=154 /DNA_ID=CAMNT_0007538793 /DNA_START=71 /DNA_END=535 /DNA_ORIENTATION=-
MSDAKAKKIRTSMGLVETMWMCLMPASNLSFWALLLSGVVDFRTTLMLIAGFYVAWALKKVVGGDKNEKGHLSYGILLVGAVLDLWYLEMLGVLAVAGSIAFVLNMLGFWPLPKLAYVTNKTILWAVVFKSYLLSMLAQMIFVGYTIYKSAVVS